MNGTYHILGIPDAVAGGFVVLALILLLAPYAGGQDFGIFKIPKFELRVRRRLRVIGPLLLILTLAAFLPIWNSDSDIAGGRQAPVEEPVHDSAQAPESRFVDDNPSWVTFTPIPDLAELIETFSVSSSPPPTIDLSFRSTSWDVQLSFQVSSALSVGELKTALLTHFRFEDHIVIDHSEFPVSGFPENELVLTANGRQISDIGRYSRNSNSDSLATHLNGGDVLRLKVVRRYEVHASPPLPH